MSRAYWERRQVIRSSIDGKRSKRGQVVGLFVQHAQYIHLGLPMTKYSIVFSGITEYFSMVRQHLLL